MEFPTQYSESVQKGSFEVFTKPSMTEPDNAMSIPEIIARFTRGQGLCVNQNPSQSGDAFGEGDPNDMDAWMEVQLDVKTDPESDPKTDPEPDPKTDPEPDPAQA